jgi:cation diffusion facilitator CzcD-associated flavoprotein CzcO
LSLHFLRTFCAPSIADTVKPDAPVMVIGAGPVGLAAAAHLSQRGIPLVLFEAGASVAPYVAGYAHVRLFSSWRYNINRAAREMLEL